MLATREDTINNHVLMLQLLVNEDSRAHCWNDVGCLAGWNVLMSKNIDLSPAAKGKVESSPFGKVTRLTARSPDLRSS